jgi:hypothetical protein
MNLGPFDDSKTPGVNLSFDTWAIIVAFLLAAFVRTGILKHIPW